MGTRPVARTRSSPSFRGNSWRGAWGRFVVALLTVPLVASSGLAAEAVLPVVEDTWIHGLGSAEPLGGTDTRLGICPVVDYWIYLKFDLTALSCPILDAELRMVRTGGARPNEITLYPIAEDGWSELTLTGVNRPEPTMPPSGTGLAAGEAVIEEGYDRWTSAALVDAVRAEADGDGIATIMLREDHGTMFDVRYYNSKDAAVADADKPRLVLETGTTDATGVTLAAAGDGVDLSWEAAGAGATYDVIGGDLAELRAGGGVSAAGCLAEDLPSPGLDVTLPALAPGQGAYYLVRVVDGCGRGSYGTDSNGLERLPLADCDP